MADEDDEDPWGFLPTNRPAPIEGGATPTRSRRPPPAGDPDPWAALLGAGETDDAHRRPSARAPGEPVAGGASAPATAGGASADPLSAAAAGAAGGAAQPAGVPPSPTQPAGSQAGASESAVSQPGAGQPRGTAGGVTPGGGAPSQPGAEVPDVIEPAGIRPGWSARRDPAQAALRYRARPMALALAGAALAGYLTEVVGNAQLLAMLGPDSMVLLYPLSGLGLLAVAMLQFREMDALARLRVLRSANLAFAVIIAVALAAVAMNVATGLSLGVIWLCADQLNFMIPLLVWAAAGDEFNVAEGRRIFGWMITWTYLGQFVGLLIGTFSPAALDGLGVPLYWLLLLDPVICLALGIWLPRAMARGRAAAAPGIGHREGLSAALAGAFEWVWGISAWRALFWGSLLVFASGMTIHLTYTMGVGIVIGDDISALQVLFGAMNLLALGVSAVVSRFFSQGILERLGIPGTLLVLPVVSVFAGLAIAAGLWADLLLPMVLAITIWRIPRLSVDESARRAALTLVPDQRRARVSFLVSLGPMALGLVFSGVVALIGLATRVFWVAPLVASLVAAAAIPFLVATVRRWDDSLLSWRIRRRKVMRHM